MTAFLILTVAFLVFAAGTVRAVRRARRLRERQRAVAQLRTAIHAATLAADLARTNRRTD